MSSCNPRQNMCDTATAVEKRCAKLVKDTFHSRIACMTANKLKSMYICWFRVWTDKDRWLRSWNKNIMILYKMIRGVTHLGIPKPLHVYKITCVYCSWEDQRAYTRSRGRSSIVVTIHSPILAHYATTRQCECMHVLQLHMLKRMIGSTAALVHACT